VPLAGGDTILLYTGARDNSPDGPGSAGTLFWNFCDAQESAVNMGTRDALVATERTGDACSVATDLDMRNSEVVSQACYGAPAHGVPAYASQANGGSMWQPHAAPSGAAPGVYAYNGFAANGGVGNGPAPATTGCSTPPQGMLACSTQAYSVPATEMATAAVPVAELVTQLLTAGQDPYGGQAGAPMQMATGLLQPGGPYDADAYACGGASAYGQGGSWQQDIYPGTNIIQQGQPLWQQTPDAAVPPRSPRQVTPLQSPRNSAVHRGHNGSSWRGGIEDGPVDLSGALTQNHATSAYAAYSQQPQPLSPAALPAPFGLSEWCTVDSQDELGMVGTSLLVGGPTSANALSMRNLAETDNFKSSGFHYNR